jgi:hypothetical protein
MKLMEKALGCVSLMAGPLLVAGCAGQWLGEEVTPEEAGLEIIVMGDGSGPDACYVNVDEMVAATHGVSVSAENGPAHVRILDHADKVVFAADSTGTLGEESDSQPKMIAADEGAAESVRLVPGDYRVECAIGTSVSTASLHVIPAPGSASD